MIKSLAHYLIESAQIYEFKIKIATIEVDNDLLDRIEHALGAFEVATISKPKRLPITARSLDFPTVQNCEVSLINVALKYPCTDEQIRAALGAQGRIPLANIVVIPKNQPEEMRRDEEDESTEKNNKAILTADLENVSGGQVQVGTKRLDSMMKEFETRKMEFAGETEKAQKTTNELPQNTVSPMVGRKGKK